MKPTETFIGPDNETVIMRRHPIDCSCEICESLHWQQVEREELDFQRRVQERQAERENHHYGI